MLQLVGVYLVPGSPALVKANFWMPCPYLVLKRYRCQGRAEVRGLHIGEQSGPRSIRIGRLTVRPRCTRCRNRISITEAEQEQLLSEAKKFLASERWQREACATHI